MRAFQLIQHWKILGINRSRRHNTLSCIWSFRSRIDQRLETSDLQKWPDIAFEKDRKLSCDWLYVNSTESMLAIFQGITILWKQLLIWLDNQEYSLQNSITNAAFNSNPLSETQLSCPTGNCTWPLFTSLGFCSKCQDIGGPLKKNVTYGDEYSGCLDPSQESSWEANIGGCGNVTKRFTYTFPELDGLSFLTLSGQPFLENRVEITPGTPMSSFYVLPLVLSNASSPDDKVWIGFIRLSSQLPRLGDVLAADVCALSFCAQKRNVSVSLNQFSSTILQTFYGTIIVPESNSEEFGYLPQLSIIGDDFNMTFSSTLQNWQTNLQQLTMNDLNGDMTQSLTNASTGIPVLLGSSNSETDISGESKYVSSNIIGAFDASSNISMTMDNIATALTNYVRDSSNITVVGQAGQVQIYVQVIWPWIILPTFLVVAGTGFLMLAMLETKRRGACIWKTSELSLLFHGLKDLDQELHALHRSSEMEHAASEIRVKMVKISGGGWILHREKGNKFVWECAWSHEGTDTEYLETYSNAWIPLPIQEYLFEIRHKL